MMRIFATVPLIISTLYSCSSFSITPSVDRRASPCVIVNDLSFSPSQRHRTVMSVMSNEEADFFEDEEEELTDEELEATMGEWDDKIARFNTVHLTGRIGNVPEPRYFDDGKVVVNISLASKRKYHSLERKFRNIKGGEEETDWYGLEIWGQTAEFVAKYVDKGARVGVIGSLQVDQWTDKETGEPRSKAKVIVRDIDVLETRAEADLRRSNRRGPSFYTKDDNNEDDYYEGPSPAGSGGFFD